MNDQITSTNEAPENHLIYTDPHIIIRQNHVDKEIKKELKKINKNLKDLNGKIKKKNKKKGPVIVTGDEIKTEDTAKTVISSCIYPINKSGPMPIFNPDPEQESEVKFSNADLLIGRQIVYTIKENPINEDGYLIDQTVYEI